MSIEERLQAAEDKLNDLDLENIKSVGCPSLRKSMHDQFDYALRLRTGEVIRFYSADFISDEWVHLTFDSCVPQVEDGVPQLPYPACRGVDVRISDIVWCMDAPEGS